MRHHDEPVCAECGSDDLSPPHASVEDHEKQFYRYCNRCEEYQEQVSRWEYDAAWKCKHGKRTCTQRDLENWLEREFCHGQGDCDCPLCSTICWSTDCVADSTALLKKSVPQQSEES